MIATNRLVLTPLTLDEVDFIFELVNTPEWIRFIGDRKIITIDDAKLYIQKIIDNPNVNYWIVRLKEHAIGVITFIKREYLEHHDIGFAFLPRYAKNGYAFEATEAVLDMMARDVSHTQILATTLKENTNSIRLLEKLGLQFDRKIYTDNEELLLYSRLCNL